MKATRFMRQPFFVIGYPVTEKNIKTIAKWCQGQIITDDNDKPLFIRVPVNRPLNRRQTEAYPGMWVLLSEDDRGEKSFKVYTYEWLMKNFYVFEGEIPDYDIVEEAVEDSGEAPRGIEGITNNLTSLPVRVPGVSLVTPFGAAG